PPRTSMGRKRSCSTCSPLRGGDNRWYLNRCGSCLILGFEARWGWRPLRGFRRSIVSAITSGIRFFISPLALPLTPSALTRHARAGGGDLRPRRSTAPQRGGWSLIRPSGTFSRREKDLDETVACSRHSSPRSLSLRERVAEGR